MRVEWHRLAQSDLVELITFIAEENPTAAVRVHSEIRRQIGMLAHHPEMGRLGRVPGTRELVVTSTPFIAAYRIAEAVTILRILHGARRWPRSLA